MVIDLKPCFMDLNAHIFYFSYKMDPQGKKHEFRI